MSESRRVGKGDLSRRWTVVLDSEPRKVIRRMSADMRRRTLGALHRL